MAVTELLNNTSKTTMTTISEFTSAIVNIRNILRTVSITGMDSMKTISIYFLAKSINLRNCEEYGIPKELAWENIVNTARMVSNEKALEYFDSGATENLFKYFDDSFGTHKLPFDLKTSNTKHVIKHKEILEIVDKLDLEHVDVHMDVLGYVYEQHLKTGASSASRDLGQYFTDRSICNYMVELCKPGFKAPGIIESICDPSMGTGGFLTSAIKYYKNLNDKINWTVQQQQIHGCDIDAKVSGLASINMFIESGHKCKNILEHDSLHNDLPQTGYDVILANMPFGIKGLKHADVCERVKALKINGTKSEPLFLQLIMASLNKGGRCAVVVPDGVLINSSIIHNGTRQYLLDNFELRKVIKMDGSFFMNTSIKPSILFFENTGCSTGPIEFCEVSKGVDGTVSEKIIITVEREELDKASTLDMRKFIVDDKPKTNTVYPMVKLGDICKVSFGQRITQKDSTGTIYPVYGSGFDTFKTDSYNRTGKTCKIGRFAISESNMVMIVNGPYWLMDSGFTVESSDTTKLISAYLWYFLSMNKQKLASFCSGSCQKNIVMDDFNTYEIPLPPLEFQQDLVRRLEALDSQLKSLDDLAKGAEDNAKYMLESYLTPSSSNQSEPFLEQLVSEEVTEAVEEVVEKPKKKLIRKIKQVE